MTAGTLHCPRGNVARTCKAQLSRKAHTRGVPGGCYFLSAGAGLATGALGNAAGLEAAGAAEVVPEPSL